MRFWDSSAVVPLLVDEAGSDATLAVAREDPVMIVWWATEIECVSALSRVEREGSLPSESVQVAVERLEALAAGWTEVQPVEAVRRAARRLLRAHRLRAADALQLAAAVVAAEGDAGSLPIVTLDDRLMLAAQREGFTVVAAA